MEIQTYADLAAYQQQAQSTADPEAFELEYLIPGIMGEVGELFGHRAKAFWHGSPAEDLSFELVSEYGDIAWMTAILLGTFGITEIDEDHRAAMNHPWAGKVDGWVSLANRALALVNGWVEDQYHLLPSGAQALWVALELRSEQITGQGFSSVLDGNLKKLSDRAARGVLKGNGDHR